MKNEKKISDEPIGRSFFFSRNIQKKRKTGWASVDDDMNLNMGRQEDLTPHKATHEKIWNNFFLFLRLRFSYLSDDDSLV